MLERTRSLACGLFPPSFTPPSSYLSFRLCPSLLLSRPVNLLFFAIREGSRVHSRYRFQRAVCRKARPLFDVSVIFVSDISRDYARCGLDRAIVSELFCSLCFSSVHISHESHAIESHVIESSWFPAENKSWTVSAASISARKIFTLHFFNDKKVESYVIARPL